MPYFSFASNSRAQQTEELISYLLNENSSDRVLKYQNSLTELPGKLENLSTTGLQTQQGTIYERWK